MKSGFSISGCVPCYNGAETLRIAAGSIRAQTLPVGELVIVDDGSTDRSIEVAFAIGDRVIRLPRNQGRGAARRRAVEKSKGEYVLFCDSALALEPSFAERAARYFSEGRIAAVFGGVDDGDASSILARWRRRHLFKSDAKQGVERGASLCTGGVMLKRSAVLDIGNFAPDLAAGEDQELGRRLLDRGWDVVRDPALRLRSLKADSLRSLLERYARWNCAPNHVPSFAEYLKLTRYHAGLALRDLAERDLPCAALTLFVPHFLFWSRRMRASGNARPMSRIRYSRVIQ